MENIEVVKIVSETGTLAGYTHIPWSNIRNCVDSLFPTLAKNNLADVAFGLHHRFKAGHDIITDVIFDTLPNKGFSAAAKQSGHIILTDFPTKAGIPIPGFSESGLGSYLVNLGIPKGYLSLNILDTGLGILSIADGTSNLFSAFSGNLEWGVGTFFNTYAKGGIEIALGISTKNPLLILGGAENIIAGTKSLYDYTVTPYILGVPLQNILTSLGTGFLFGSVISFLFSRGKPLPERLKNSLIDGTKGGIFSGLFAINPLFGFSAVATYAVINISKNLASYRGISFNKLYHINIKTYLNLLEDYIFISEDNDFINLIKKQNDIAFFKDIEDNIFLNIADGYYGLLPLNNELNMNQYSNIFRNQVDEYLSRKELFIEYENIFNEHN